MSDFNKYIYHITANSACTVVKNSSIQKQPKQKFQKYQNV